MKFCPVCQTRLKTGLTGLRCNKCDYSEAAAVRVDAPSTDTSDSGFNVLDESEGREVLPTIKIDCGRCGHDEAVWWMLQTRSADEPTTQFYRCVKCKYTWRNYS